MDAKTKVHRILPKPVKIILNERITGKTLTQIIDSAEKHVNRKLPSIKWGSYRSNPDNKPETVWIRRSLCNCYQQTIKTANSRKDNHEFQKSLKSQDGI